MDVHKQSAAEVIESVNSDIAMGLTPAKIEKSKEVYGINQLTQAKRKSIFKRIWEGLTEPMMIILLVALAITLAVNIIKVINGEAFDYIECIGIVVAIALSVTITIVMEGRSAKAFDALNKMGENILVKTLRDGNLQKVSQQDLVVGDIVKFEVGDKIPVDARLIETTGFNVDESPLTGESAPVKKDASLIFGEDKIPLAERRNMIYGGCFVTAGNALAVVTSVGDSTEIGAIAKELAATEVALTPLQHKLDKLGKTITIIGATAAAAVFVIQLIMLFVNSTVSFNTVQEIFITSIVLIVASVPEGLPTIVAVSLALNVIKMAKQNALVKKMVACETVGCISVICSDKTGTLTENKMTVQGIYTTAGMIEPEKLTDVNLLKNFCINTSASVSEDKGVFNFIGSPTEGALLVAYSKTNPSKTYLQMREETKVAHGYPFSSELKKMTTIADEGGNLVAYSKGAPEIIIEMCEISSIDKKAMLDKIGEFQNQAKRVIGFAHGTVKKVDFDTQRDCVEKGLVFDGFVVISDPIRKEVYAAVEACNHAGVSIKMLTGDNIITARAIARELKIISDDNEVFHAHQIENMSDDELEKTIYKIKVVARSTPMTKLRIVNMLKKLNEVVAVTGDGINDAPAIKNADVGISMGITGTEVSKEASDIVLLDDSFSTIVKSVHWGRGIYENFQRFIMFQLTVNLSAVLVVIICLLTNMPSPFNALELLWINLIMDGPPALTLGLEAIRGDIMNRKPTNRDASIVTAKMMSRILANGIWITLVIILQAKFNFLCVPSQMETTVIFTLFVVFQLFNAFNARELTNKSIFGTLHNNKIMLIVMLCTFMLQVLITQFGAVVFNTTALDFITWTKLVGAAITVVAVCELYKLATFLFLKIRGKSKAKPIAA